MDDAAVAERATRPRQAVADHHGHEAPLGVRPSRGGAGTGRRSNPADDAVGHAVGEQFASAVSCGTPKFDVLDQVEPARW